MQAPSGPQGHGRALLAPPPSPWTPPGSPSAGFRISKAEFYSSAPRKHALRDTALPYRGSPGESGEGARISLPHQLPAQPPGIAQPPPRPPSRLLRPPPAAFTPPPPPLPPQRALPRFCPWERGGCCGLSCLCCARDPKTPNVFPKNPKTWPRQSPGPAPCLSPRQHAEQTAGRRRGGDSSEPVTSF